MAKAPQMTSSGQPIRHTPLSTKIWNCRGYYLMFIPVLIFVLIMHYWPMLGIRYAFMNFRAFGKPTFIGLAHFQDMFHEKGFWTAFRNTLELSVIKLFLTTFTAVVASVFLNEMNTLWAKKSLQTVIYLPEDSYGSLKVNTVSGEVEVPEKYAFNDVAINTTSGSITCDCTATGDIEIGTVSGEITFSSVNSNKFKASSTSGSVKLSNAKVSGAVTIDTVSGEIILNDVESGSLNTNSVSGDVTFTNLTTDDVNIDTTSGEVSGTITGDHEYDVDTVSGDVSLPSDIKGGAMVNISTVSGDVEIEAA